MFPDPLPSLAERIYKVRTRNHLTQKDFAERLGVSRSFLSEVEGGKGKPSIEILVGIANELPRVRLEWLLTGKGGWLNDVETQTNDCEKADKTAILASVINAGAVIQRYGRQVGPHAQAMLIAMLYNAYMLEYTRSSKAGLNEAESRHNGKMQCKIIADTFDPQFLESVSMAPHLDDDFACADDKLK